MDLKRQVKVLSQEHPIIPKVELMPDNTWVRKYGDEEVDQILVGYEKERESQNHTT